MTFPKALICILVAVVADPEPEEIPTPDKLPMESDCKTDVPIAGVVAGKT